MPSQPGMAIMAVNSCSEGLWRSQYSSPGPGSQNHGVQLSGQDYRISLWASWPCLKDTDPYVQKTAVVCVAKLHYINAQIMDHQGLLDSLQDLRADLNPLVIANTVPVLSEISESYPNSNLLELNPMNINKLLIALNECTEWGQIFLPALPVQLQSERWQRGSEHLWVGNCRLSHPTQQWCFQQ